jgi:hypothetical protein
VSSEDVQQSRLGTVQQSRLGTVQQSRLLTVQQSRLGTVQQSRLGTVQQSRLGTVQQSILGTVQQSREVPRALLQLFSARAFCCTGAVAHAVRHVCYWCRQTRLGYSKCPGCRRATAVHGHSDLGQQDR